MSTFAAASSFYVLGGTLRRDAPCYVERSADVELTAALKEGRFCYVLTSRQMGKSSLMNRTRARLRQDGLHVAAIDLTRIGQNLTVEQWYLGLLSQIGSDLELEDEIDDFWDEHGNLSPLQRWMGALRDVVLRRRSGAVVIFIDEIDATRALQFSTDEFFAGIRELYNERSEDPELRRLTFCLLGVATPSDLIRNPNTTPFNIGQRIDLTDFTEAEAGVLVTGLNRPRELAHKLLERVLFWTGGHPYLTQQLCQAVGEDPEVINTGGVDRLCTAIFLSPAARERNDNLLFARDRILRSDEDVSALLTTYARILRGERVKDDPANPLLNVLRLSGVVRAEAGFLRIRNRIYQRVFNKEFVRANLPLDEAQRQREAERRGRIKAFALATPIALVFLAMAVGLWLQNRAVSEQKKTAEDKTEEATAMAVFAQMANGEAQKNAAESKEEARKAEESAVEAEKQREKADRLAAQATQARHEAEEQRQAAEENAREAERQGRLAQRNNKALEQQRKNSLDVASKGVESAWTIAVRLNDLSEKQEVIEQHPEVIDISLETMGIARYFADSVLQLDPANERATNLRALAMYFQAFATEQLAERKSKRREDVERACKETSDYARALEKSSDTWRQAIAVRTYATMAPVWWSMGQHDAAKEAAAKAGKLASSIAPSVKADDNVSLNALAWGLYFGAQFEKTVAGNWDAAMSDYLLEINIEQKYIANLAAQNDKPDVLTYTQHLIMAGNALGDNAANRKQYESARKAYEQFALKFARKVEEWSDKPEFQRSDEQKNAARRDVWSTLENVAAVVAEQKQNRAEAVSYYRAAIKEGELVLKTDPTANTKKLEGEYDWLANVEKMQGRIVEARADYRKQIELVKQHEPKDPKVDDVTELADSYAALGDFEKQYGEKNRALEAYQSEWKLLIANPDYQQDIRVQGRIAEAALETGHVQSLLGRSADAKRCFEEAKLASQKYVELVQKAVSNTYQAQRTLSSAYESLAMSNLALGDRNRAAEYLRKSLEPRRQAAEIAAEELRKDNSYDSRSTVVSAYGNLAWIELLNGEPGEAIQAIKKAQKTDAVEADQPWIWGNLAHAYLLTGRVSEALAIYEKNRGETVKKDLFEHSVFEDFDTLRKLGITSPDMAMVEGRLRG